MEVVKYDLNTAAIAKMSDIYMQLKIDGIDDETGASEVHAAKMIVVKHRTNINKLRLGTNRNAQDFIKKNNKDAAVLIDALAPIEGHLKAEEGKVDAEKERIQAEKETAEKIKIEERVAALFAVDVNIPYFDAAMLLDADYLVMYGEATEIYQAKQLEIEEEKKAKIAEEKRLADEKAAQEAEANRLAEIQAAQKAEAEKIRLEQEVQRLALEAEKKKIAREQAEKDAAVDAEYKKIVAEKQKMQEAKEKIEREAQERLERELFEKQAKEKATGKARFECLQDIGFTYPLDDLGTMPESQYAKIHDEHQKAWDTKQNTIFLEKLEKERIEQIAKVEETRLRSLQAVGFVYQAKDLGAMQDKKFFALHEKHKKAWDKKQKEILAEKIEQDRLKAEKAAAAEKARVEALLPDKEKLVKYAASILKLSAPDIKNKKAQQIMDKAQDGLSVIVNDIMQQVEEL